MKRIVKLKGELLVIAIIALGISFLIAMTIKSTGITKFYNKSFESRISYIYFETITNLEEDLGEMDIKNSTKLQEFFDGDYHFKYGYNFYVVDKSGKVIAGNNKEVLNIDENKIIDGEREYVVENKDRSVFRISGCDYLKDGYYLYYIYCGYGHDDSRMMVYAIVLFVILFFSLIWGRVSYISKIKSSVRIIAQGNLSYRAPVKYKNELMELAEDINSMASELEKEDKKRGELLTNISHDLRTPLTTILGYIDMIKKDKYDSKEQLEKYIDVMERKGIFLKNMLDDFFQYSKLSSKDINLNLQVLELNELSRQILEDEESVFKENSLNLSMKLSNEHINIYGDPELIVRAVNNLLSNTLKYSKENTKVGISIDKENINDTSYGAVSISNIPKESVSEEEINNFFERMYKKDRSRHEAGSGLGLSIVKDILKIHDGFVKGYKEEDKLVFKIYIKESEM
ncbi:MAG: histidine kinase dimerization/phospho-acceptor domain-containing protein [Clostridiaceae bacterium]